MLRYLSSLNSMTLDTVQTLAMFPTKHTRAHALLHRDLQTDGFSAEGLLCILISYIKQHSGVFIFSFVSLLRKSFILCTYIPNTCTGNYDNVPALLISEIWLVRTVLIHFCATAALPKSSFIVMLLVSILSHHIVVIYLTTAASNQGLYYIHGLLSELQPCCLVLIITHSVLIQSTVHLLCRTSSLQRTTIHGKAF